VTDDDAMGDPAGDMLMAPDPRPHAPSPEWGSVLRAMSFVNYHVRRYGDGAGVPKSDLRQDAIVACYEATAGYDPACGYSLKARRRYLIRAALRDRIGDAGVARVPRNARNRAWKVAGGRAPGPDPSPAAGSTVAYALAAMGRGVAGPIATVAARDESPADAVERRDTLDALRRAVAALPGLERDVIRMHYSEGMSLAEVGRRFGFSRQYARQVEVRARRSLRAALEPHDTDPPRRR
jgi:RNA polymerase sigma factor (sigma-70 family)